MANQPEVPVYDAGVYQIETVDAVLGGVGGIANISLLNLADRTAYLKQHMDNIESGATVIPGKAPLNSPGFTGSPTVPTPPIGDNSLLIANTTFTNFRFGIATVNVAGNTNVVLAQSQWGLGIIIFIGALTGSINVTFPTTGKWIVCNRTTGAFSMTCKTAAGTGIAPAQGTAVGLIGDATNIVRSDNEYTNAALIGVPTAPTPAPGDSTTKIATTAFVQNAINSLLQPYAVDTGTANHVVATLPSSPTLNPGFAVRVLIANNNTGGSDFNLDGVGALPIHAPDGSPLVPGDLLAGETAEFVFQVTFWQYSRVTATQSRTGNVEIASPAQVAALADTLRVLTPGLLANAFPSVFGTNGYVKIPTPAGVLIVQWCRGVSQVASDDSTQTITYPIPFPNAVFAVFITSMGTGISSDAFMQLNGPPTLTQASVMWQIDDLGGPGTGTANQTPLILAIGF